MAMAMTLNLVPCALQIQQDSPAVLCGKALATNITADARADAEKCARTNTQMSHFEWACVYIHLQTRVYAT